METAYYYRATRIPSMKQTVLVALAGDKERADVVALIDNHQLERISAFKGRGLTKRVGPTPATCPDQSFDELLMMFGLEVQREAHES